MEAYILVKYSQVEIHYTCYFPVYPYRFIID